MGKVIPVFCCPNKEGHRKGGRLNPRPGNLKRMTRAVRYAGRWGDVGMTKGAVKKLMKKAETRDAAANVKV